MASLAKQTTQIIMSETPRTDARVFDADLVSASFARELERENAKLLGLLGEVFQCIEYAERCGGLDSVTEIKVRRALAALPNA